jgi:5-methylcytosine-specific restriction endonuclease McrA
MDQKVLLLNQDYSAISICSISKAFILLYLQKAEMVVKSENGVIRTVSQAFPRPSVIRLQHYVRVPYKGISLSRHNVMRRDHFQCQYCGTNKTLTIDHLLPRSRGGQSSWLNLVTACNRCNSLKGNRTPEEAGLSLRLPPRKPTLSSFLNQQADSLDHSWRPYLKAEN